MTPGTERLVDAMDAARNAEAIDPLYRAAAACYYSIQANEPAGVTIEKIRQALVAAQSNAITCELATVTQQRNELMAACEVLIKSYVKNKGTKNQFIAMIGGGSGPDTITPEWERAIAAVATIKEMGVI